MASRTVRSEAVVLRSIRFGEADRILQLFTRERGRIGAIAKGARKTRSRFGARLEPFSHVEIFLHEGRGELATLTGADFVRAHQRVRDDFRRVGVGQIGLEAMLRLFVEHDANEGAFHALARFVDLLEELDPFDERELALDPLVLGFQLKLLWLAGYLPHLASCAVCDAAALLVAFSAASGGAVCAECQGASPAISAAGLSGLRALLEHPLAQARQVGPQGRAAREALRVVEGLYEFHGGFRMRTLTRR